MMAEYANISNYRMLPDSTDRPANDERDEPTRT